ncbi:TPA: hypothetical protein QHN47_004460 [Klebsiella aerogenes]|nr:hypothetical protein [Klebsiella aerogenes]HDT5519427.1 hypothetical protein [Klebsiella aerogenes]
MIHLSLPAFDDLEIFEKCATAHEDITLDDYATVVPVIKALYDEYHAILQNGDIVKLKRSNDLGKFSNVLMKSLYTEHLVGKNAICRDYYDKLLASAPLKKCPMCSESIVNAIDHHAPKQTYFAFSVFTKNLVPICTRCNEAKQNTMPNALDKQFIHPYYDDFSKVTWFEMKFINKNPIDVEFTCLPNNQYELKVQQKLQSHFKKLKLNELYSSNALVKLGDLKNTFTPYFVNKDWSSVEEDIEYMFATVSRRPDSWEYALYKTLLSEQWYIEGGFDNIYT